MRGEFAKFVLAAQFLTRLPLRTDRLFTPERMAEAPRYFALVGLLIGSVCAGMFWLAALLLPHLVAILIAMGASLLITGAFHEDGLADTFDGVGGGLDTARALEIMKDSRLGTYGAAALFMALAVKAGALFALPPLWICAAFPLAHCLSRGSGDRDKPLCAGRRHRKARRQRDLRCQHGRHLSHHVCSCRHLSPSVATCRPRVVHCRHVPDACRHACLLRAEARGLYRRHAGRRSAGQ